MVSDLRCGALTQAGTRCQANAVESTDWWRCRRHIDWHENATPAERYRLAELEIEELCNGV